MRRPAMPFSKVTSVGSLPKSKYCVTKVSPTLFEKEKGSRGGSRKNHRGNMGGFKLVQQQIRRPNRVQTVRYHRYRELIT